MNRGALTVFALLLLATSANSFALGVSNYDGPDAATVTGHIEKHGFANWEMYTFESVDGHAVSGLRGQDALYAKFHLRPGNHRIGILYQSPKGFLRGFFVVEAVLDVTFNAGGNYQLGGSRTGDRLRAWVEEVGTHNIVSRLVWASGPILHKDEIPPEKAIEGTGPADLPVESPKTESPSTKP